jgi:anti-anti-sigma factor
MSDLKEDFRVGKLDSDGVITIRAAGSATDRNLMKFEKALNEAQGECLVVDLSELDYMCSWGLGVLVERARALKERGARLVVIRPRTRLWKLFELLQLNVLLNLVEDESAALRAARETPEEGPGE